MENCKTCGYRCRCCSRYRSTSCSDCRSTKDRFEHPSNINYCPLTGEQITRITSYVVMSQQSSDKNLSDRIHEFLEANGGLTHEEIAMI